MIKQYGEWIVRFRWLVLLLSLVAVMFLASGGRFLAFTNDYRVWFSDDNPELLRFEALQESYTKSDNILVMLEPKSGDAFSKETLTAVADLTERSWQVPFSVRVDSLSNFQHIYGEEDDLIVEDLVDDPQSLGADDLLKIREVAMSQTQLVDKLVSARADTTGVNITIELPPELSDEDRALPPEERNKKDPAVATQVAVDYTRQMLAEMRDIYPDIDFVETGVVVMNQAFPEASITDMTTIIPMAFGVIILGILVLIASPVAAFSTVVVVLLSILAAMGSAGWLGIKLTPPSASAPTLILTLAVADCVHFLVTFYHHVRRGMSKNDAVVESLRVNFAPIALTSITTAIGFLSMNFSDAPPFHDLGNITAMGVIAAFFLAVTFLPALISVLPVKVKQKAAGKTTLMDTFASFVINQRKWLMWCMLAIMVTLSLMTPRNELNDVFVHYFDKSVPFRANTDRVTEKLSGMYLVDYSLESGEEGGVSNPEFLQQVEKFENYLKEQPEVQHVSAYTETMRRLNRSMHGDKEEWYKLPGDRELSAQYTLLYNMSLPYGLDLNNMINFDSSATRVSATLATLSSKDLLVFEDRVALWMEQNTPEIATIGSGATSMFSHIGMRNIVSMLSGTSIALVLISLILIFALRSLKFGLISLIPNIAPALMAFGVWGLTRGEVGLAVSVVVAMTLGIVVDDTIHFLSKYLRARREQGLSAEESVRYAFNTVGVALLITTIVLVGGFLVISTSNFQVNSQMGLLTALTITIALIVDFLFLPPLLIKLDGDKDRKSQDQKSQEGSTASELKNVGAKEQPA